MDVNNNKKIKYDVLKLICSHKDPMRLDEMGTVAEE